MPPLSEDLKESISAYIKAWHMMSGVYAGVSFVLRLTLITRSALVAAKVGAGKYLNDWWAATLSIYVAAGTGLEAWLMPREKWKGFMTECENAEDLLMQLNNSDTVDPKKADEFRVEFQRQVATHREKNVL